LGTGPGENVDPRLALFLPFVPKLALRLFNAQNAVPEQPCQVSFAAAVLLADVSGFTGLVETLAREYGDRGAEEIQDVLNRCFAPLADCVDRHGGQVLCFPGDAALALWTTPEDGPGALATLVRQSAECGLDLLASLDRLTVAAGRELRLRIAVGAGPSAASLVGGVSGRWETVMGGAAVAQLEGTLAIARPGELVVSEAAYVHTTEWLRGNTRSGRFVVSSLAPGKKVSEPVRVAPDPPLDPVRSFVPAAVLARIDAGQHAWLAEFRVVTVVFLRVRDAQIEDLATLHRTMQAIQTTVARYGGQLNQTVADEKGLTAVVAFGLADSAHEDDGTRAVLTALATRQAMADFGINVRCGVATGRIFTGGRGGQSRLEFALMGPSVVLAARLAAATNDILCDEATRSACRRSIHFEPLPPMQLKGLSSAVEVWRPVSAKQDARRSRAGIVGRQRELAVLEGRITALEYHSQGGVVCLEGEAGIGKTALLNELSMRARSHAVRAFSGGGDSIEQGTSYLAWRNVFMSVIGSHAMSDRQTLADRLTALAGPDNVRWLPLLNAALGISQSENEHTASLDADGRAQTTRDLLISALLAVASTSPILIVLEDAHWMDSASWELAECVVTRIPRSLVVISVRPPVERLSTYTRLTARTDATTIRLGPLDFNDTRELICRRLEAEAIPDALATLVHRRAEGHALFAEELSVALRNRALVVVRDGRCTIASGLSREATDVLPDTVRGIVAMRIDQLSPNDQLTLKVAAVLGRRFRLPDLIEIHPLGHTLDGLEKELDRIAKAGLLRREELRDDTYSFSHALIQEVAYELLPYAQRQGLHRRTAEWLERMPNRNIEDSTQLLAYHWQQANVLVRAMAYLEKASEQALRRDSSFREAEDFLTRLLTLAAQLPETSTSEYALLWPAGGEQAARARWTRMLSETLARQGRHALAMEQLERSLQLVGKALPSPTVKDRLEFLVAVMRRLLLPPPAIHRVALTRRDQLALLETARGYDDFVRLLYLGVPLRKGTTIPAGEVTFLSGLALLRGARAAERVGPCAELSRAYSLVANIVAMFRRPTLASAYVARARSIAEKVGDRHAQFRALTFGPLTSFILGNWSEATADLKQGLALGEELRATHECLISAHTLAFVSLNNGQLDEAVRQFTDINRRARADDDVVPQLWALASLGEVAFRQGDLGQARAHAEASIALADRTKVVDQNGRFQAHGLLAAISVRRGEFERARLHATAAIAAAHAGARLSYAPQAGFFGVADTLFALADQGSSQVTRGEIKRWLRSLQVVAFCRPIMTPWHHLFRAQWHVRRKRSWSARRHLRRGMAAADRMRLPYEAAMIRLELARLLPTDSVDSRRLLEQARVGLEGMGAAQENSAVRKERASAPGISSEH
jgi:class 3 adenylate cyclase/tetratricopeptide (TPR) repeat protein